MKWLIHAAVLILVLISETQGLGDPYKILGVHRTALPQEIRKAYKKLAIEWHPDKNSDPSAETKFVEINQAYELLSDPERRKHYDKFGITENGPQFHRKNDYSQYRSFDPLEDLFGFPPHGFDFKFESRDISLFHKLSITTRAYENKLVPKSYGSPQLVLFYTDWCVACFQVEPVWRRVLDELEPLGVGASTVHAEKEQLLARKLGVHGLPCLIVLLDGRAAVYKDSLYSVQKIVEFVRNKFPYKLVQPVNDETAEDFLGGWTDNRIRALIFERQETIRLRYLLMAFYYRERVAFGFVQLNSPNSRILVQQYQVPTDIESFLLFNENSQRPTASLSMADIPVKTMRDVIDNNKYLLLPRLSSQAMLDALCPVEWARPRKRLCVVLISENTPYHDEPRHELRQLAQETHYSSDRVRFAYIYKERQPEFVAALTSGVVSNSKSEEMEIGGAPEEPSLHIVVIWRRDASHLKYEWAPHEWQASSTNEWNETRALLESTIDRLLRASEALSYETVVNELTDEHAQGVATRLVNRFLLTVEFLRDHVTKDQLLPVLSVIATLLLILAAGYLMAYLVKIEEENIKKQPKRRPSERSTKENVRDRNSTTPTANHDLGYNNNRKWTPSGLTKEPSAMPQLRLHELRAETYNGMVRLLKPGCRTLVLLVDSQSRNKLLPDFHKMVWPYRKNKTLMFGHLSLDKGLDWYKNLLTLSLPEPRDLNINPRNCIGTVLSLNGHRKYFCMYHAKHPECVKGKGAKRLVKITRQLGNQRTGNTTAAFMGFETSDSEDTDGSDLEQGSRALDQASLLDSKYGNVVFQGNLLDGFPNWLDRLFEGSTHRYYINYWPDFAPK